MGWRRGRTLALGASVALVAGPPAIVAAIAPAVANAAPSGAAADAHANVADASRAGVRLREREVLVRPIGGTLQRVTLPAGADPVAVAAKLRRRTDVIATAGANFIATAAGVQPATASQAITPSPTPAATAPISPPITSDTFPAVPPGLRGWIPNDHVGDLPWTALQWNFVGDWGVRAPQAWEELRTQDSMGVGGRGVKVAVLDSGIAYRDRAAYRRSPDIDPERLLTGYDFVDEDRFPDDYTGHGTHVSSLIAGATGNDSGLTGLAYEASILPIRVLDEDDEGDVVAIARGIRYAVRRKADLINLSVDFPSTVTSAEIPEVMAAIRSARRAGVLVIASSGNDGVGEVSLPARSASVLSVGATTTRGCRSTFSNAGPALDLVAPGGGSDHRSEPTGRCKPKRPGPPIAQVTLVKPGDRLRLGVPLDYIGTSMAAAHVTAIAALVRASGVLGSTPSPDLLAAYLVRSTRDLGPKGRDPRYGAGLIDAQLAVNPRTSIAAVRGARRAARNNRPSASGLPVR